MTVSKLLINSEYGDIRIKTRTQGDSTLLDARQIHTFLKVSTVFRNWIKRRIEEYGFKEQEDYQTSKNGRLRGSDKIDYFVTMQMAQELAMLEKNAIGRKFRRYFIEKEEELRAVKDKILSNDMAWIQDLAPKRINDRVMYHYRDVCRACGYSSSGSARKVVYTNHFVKMDGILYVSREMAGHMYESKRVYLNRYHLKAMPPVIASNFGTQPLLFS
jgi:phage anti-repressor protein